MDAKPACLWVAPRRLGPSKPVSVPRSGRAIRHDGAGGRAAGFREVSAAHSIARRRGQGRGCAVAVEGAEELAQNPIEQAVRPTKTRTTQEAITRYLVSHGALAADRLAGSWAARPMPVRGGDQGVGEPLPPPMTQVPDAQSGQEVLAMSGDKLPAVRLHESSARFGAGNETRSQPSLSRQPAGRALILLTCRPEATPY